MSCGPTDWVWFIVRCPVNVCGGGEVELGLVKIVGITEKSH